MKNRVMEIGREFINLYNGSSVHHKMNSMESVVGSPAQHIREIEYILGMLMGLMQWDGIKVDLYEEYYIVAEELEDLLVG